MNTVPNQLRAFTRAPQPKTMRYLSLSIGLALLLSLTVVL